MNANVNDIKSVESEAGVISTLFIHPEFCFHSENLKPRHFTDPENACLYYAITELAKNNVEKVDPYNLMNVLNSKENMKKWAEEFTPGKLNELMEMSRMVARSSVAEYMLAVNNVLDKAFRRDAYKKLAECQNLCFSENEDHIEEKIYNILDGVLMDYSSTNELPAYKDVVDELWQEIVDRQNNGMAGVPFKFPALNNYVQLEAGELVIVGANAKQGKSMFLLNEAVDLLKRDYSVLYLDSELSSRMFTQRLMSNLTGIEYSRIRSGQYTAEENDRLEQARSWLKTRKFTHKYMPIFDPNGIYAAAKKSIHSQGTQVLIVDYFKGGGSGASGGGVGSDDAFATYQQLGRLVDMVKNVLCGDMGLIGLGAAQTTSTGKLADSAKIARNASTILTIENKTPQEISQDGIECGNKKLRVVLNRNGEQMSSNEYIDLQFNGNLVSYKQAAKQHDPNAPY